MEISYCAEKRDWTLRERGLDFEEAREVFAGPTIEFVDDRKDYGELRRVTFERLRGRLVALVWTERGQTRHIISMRKANDREKAIFDPRLG